MKFKVKPGLIFIFLLLIIMGACHETDPVSPPETDGTDEFSFQIQLSDTTGNPVEGIRVHTNHLLSIPIWMHRDRSAVTFTMTIPVRCHCLLEVFRFDGQKVRTLSNGMIPAGWHGYFWDGRDDTGEQVLDGIYEVRLTIKSEEGQILYAGSELCDNIWGFDHDRGPLGFTDSGGRLIWRDRQNFPSTYELPPLYQTWGTSTHVDTFTVLDSVFVCLTDTLLGHRAHYTVPIINGKNEFHFTWIPERSRKSIEVEVCTLHPAEEGVSLETEATETDTLTLPTEFRLYTPFPNPFN